MTIEQALNTALAHHTAGRYAEAEPIYRQVLAQHPDHPIALHLLGIIALEGRHYADAEGLVRRGIQFAPDRPDFHNTLGVVLQTSGRAGEAIEAFQRACDLQPNFADAMSNLSALLGARGQLTKAAMLARQAVAIKPALADAHNNLGHWLTQLGQAEEGVAEHRAAISLRPTHASASSNLLYALHLVPTTDAQTVEREHKRWREVFEQPLMSHRRPHANIPDRHRRLRVGYVSPDFRQHALSFFIAPVLEHHNRAQYEIFCYSDVLHEDEVTANLRRGADHWIESRPLTHQALAQQIIDDKIDLLVDLSVHSAANRLPAFAFKPAPVQLSYLGYCGTTGVEAIDYRMTDDVVDPHDMTEPWSTEELLRLPRSFCCYSPAPQTPAVGPLPALKNGHVTFGAFNNLSKTTPAMLDLWARLLSGVPEARFFMIARAFDDAAVRDRVLGHFTRGGIAADRIELHAGVSLIDYYDLFNRIDIALDTFPFNGHTTTCHAMWMGVPTVSLTGEDPVSRVAASLLRHVNLQYLVGSSPDEYIATVAELARNHDSLPAIRASLREGMKSSALMDAAGFTTDLENAYRAAWTRWCDSRSTRDA